jgi:hypothetical protein
MRAISTDSLGKASMGTHEVEVGLVQVHLPFKPEGIFGKGKGLAGEPPVLMAQAQVVSFDAHGVNPLQGDISEDGSFENSHNVSFFIALFYHLPIAQRGAGNHFGSPWSSAFTGTGICFNDMMSFKQGGTVRVKAVADPQRPSICAEPLFSPAHQWLRQGGLRRGQAEHDHESSFRRQGDPNPDFAFQSSARRRRSFFLTKLHRASNSTWETFNSLTIKALICSLCSAATLSQWRTVSSFTSITSATARRDMPLTSNFKAMRTFSCGVRRS